MGCSREAAILNTYLQKALDEEIRRGDFSNVIEAVAANPSGRGLAWNFLRSKWDEIYDKYEGNLHVFKTLTKLRMTA